MVECFFLNLFLWLLNLMMKNLEKKCLELKGLKNVISIEEWVNLAKFTEQLMVCV